MTSVDRRTMDRTIWNLPRSPPFQHRRGGEIASTRQAASARRWPVTGATWFLHGHHDLDATLPDATVVRSTTCP